MGWNSAYRSLSDEMDTHVLLDLWAWHGFLCFSYIVLERRGEVVVLIDTLAGSKEGVWFGLRNFADGVSCDMCVCIQTLVVAFTRAPQWHRVSQMLPKTQGLGSSESRPIPASH